MNHADNELKLRGREIPGFHEPSRWRLSFSFSAGILLLLIGCATPIQVQRVDPRVVHRELTTNVISTGDLSEPTRIVLHREDLDEYFNSYPEQVIANLHRTATAGIPDPDLLYALSELSFRHASPNWRGTRGDHGRH
jgi:hypothetical protein